MRFPLGGMAWHYLQYVLGLLRMGADAYYFEDSHDFPSCYDPVRNVTDTDPTYGLVFAERTFERVGLDDRWAYYDAHTARWFGPCADRREDLFRTADLLLNVSGLNPIRPWLENIPVRVFVDSDPAFTQIRHLTYAPAQYRARQHTAFFSWAENIEAGRSRVPDDGFPWQATRQPIVLDLWPLTIGPAHRKFTTVMQWESYRPMEYGGVQYGMKSDAFWPYVELPAQVGRVFELAVGGPTVPRALLRRKGWALRDSRIPSRDPWTYRRYIQGSKAEFGPAKLGYVVSHSGFFAERTAAYLASGRPVVVQDTGFSDFLPSDSGLLPFTTPDEALDRIEQVCSRYAYHCTEARAVAEEYFDATKVLRHLVERAMAPSSARAGQAATRASGSRTGGTPDSRPG
jgi:hypothetical protein